MHSKFLLLFLALPCHLADAAELIRASVADLRRAAVRVPRAAYRGDGFTGMSNVLNGHLRRTKGLTTRPCNNFTARELQEKVLTPIFELASPDLLTIFALHDDNRQRPHASLQDLRSEWSGINHHVENYPGLHDVHRDGLCHEAVMWFVHHLSEDGRRALLDSLSLPLLPMQRHALTTGFDDEASAVAHSDVHANYETKVSCQQCHSGPVWSSIRNATLPPPMPVDKEHPGRERLRSCDYQNDPPCGPCEGLGGPRWGDSLDKFVPVNCSVVAEADAVPESLRPKPSFPALGQAHIDGDTRSPLEVRPTKPGKYPKVNATISLAWGTTVARHRYDFQDMPPFGQPASQIYLQTMEQIASRNNSGVMVSIIGQEGKASVCVCTDAIAGIMHIDSFVPHAKDDPFDLPGDQGGLKYLGRIKLSPIDGGGNSVVVADHYMKWAFHFLVDADPKSAGYGMPLRLYGQQGVRFIYSKWSTEDPRVNDPGLFKIPRFCLPLSKTCRQMRDAQDAEVTTEFV